jgi:hypothetical protein
MPEYSRTIFGVQGEVRNPTRGVFVNLKNGIGYLNFYTPSPRFENLLPGCAEHSVCMRGVPYRNLGVWGSPSSPSGIKEGV